MKCEEVEEGVLVGLLICCLICMDCPPLLDPAAATDVGLLGEAAQFVWSASMADCKADEG